MNILLYGKEEADEDENADIEMDMTQEGTVYYTTEYEGVVNMLKRWFAAAAPVKHSGLGGKIYGIENLCNL